MKEKISSDIIEKWLMGWSLSREKPLPVKYKSGFKIEVGDPEQKSRYIFTEPNEDFFQLTQQIDEPWVFLKVCASSDEFKNNIPDKWKVWPQGYMMSCFQPMHISNMSLHKDYQLEYDHYNSTSVVKILTKTGEPASIGRVAIFENTAVYDRISTESNHRRKGLASFLMRELEKIALSQGGSNSLLVATEEGRSLYESLGWELYSLFTSIVIPGKV